MLPICTPFDGSDPAEATAVLISFTRRANWVEAGCRLVSAVTTARTSENACRFQVSSAGNLICMLPSFMRSRVVNPKWIAGVMRHGYKGAFEIAASVDYLFAFAATTHAVKDHHFDAVHAAFMEDEAVRDFMAQANPAALRETAARLHEALDRGLWKPRSNSAAMLLSSLKEDRS